MQVEFIVNGRVQLLLCPETEAEIALLKQMLKQDNELLEIRSQVQVLNKSFRSGLVIAPKPLKKDDVVIPVSEEPPATDESQTKNL